MEVSKKNAVGVLEMLITTQEAFPAHQVFLGKLQIESMKLALSALRSELMEEQAGVDQKAWEEKYHSCYDCKWDHNGLFDEPCIRCDAENKDLWEEKENENNDDTSMQKL